MNDDDRSPFGECCRNCVKVQHCTNSRGTEQILVSHILPFFKAKTKLDGVFVELGGSDGVFDSNTIFLERCLRWKGIQIEGHPTNFAQLVLNRPGLVGIASSICEEHGLTNLDEEPGSLARGGYHMNRKKCKVPCGPLRDYMNLLELTHIDFLSLAVEGAELEVLESIDWDAFSISAMVVEELEEDAQKNEKVVDLLKSTNMTFLFRMAHDAYYVNPNFVDISRLRSNLEQNPVPQQSPFQNAGIAETADKCRVVFPGRHEPNDWGRGCANMTASIRASELRHLKGLKFVGRAMGA